MSKEDVPKKGWAKTVLIGLAAGILALYVSYYVHASRSPGMKVPAGWKGYSPGFLYVPASRIEQRLNNDAWNTHVRLRLIYTPLNYIDRMMFGGPEPTDRVPVWR